jgi:hypothetical protein
MKPEQFFNEILRLYAKPKTSPQMTLITLNTDQKSSIGTFRAFPELLYPTAHVAAANGHPFRAARY